ncbi:MAG: CRISPR-associated protein (Cas_NE0113) [Alphaproteobacteria bacterium ADurb.Bin438]|nr:MAG: CRISPR-associated protein (Cas_NE0113) [Alphaproteobacteria bacterium ADurb.Bin438]
MSLYGRENDKLFHVLVSKEYEQNRDFYFPYSDDEYIKSELELSEIPFVRLNNFLKDTNTLSYEDAVSKVQKKIEPLKLIIDLDNKKIFINENIVCMPPLLFCFYVYFAILKKEGNGKINWQTIEINQIIKLYEKLYNKQLEKNNFDDISYFLEKKSRINKIIKQEILKDNDIFLIKINGKRPSSTYEIGIEKQNIIIKGGL